MNVNVLPGQQNITERDLGHLQQRLSTLQGEYQVADETARRKHAEIVAVQIEIDDELARMREAAPMGTKWKAA